MKRKGLKAQTSLEYMLLISLAVAALLAMRVFITRGVQERFRQGADTFGSGEQYVNSSLTNVISYDADATHINRPAAAQGNACAYAQLAVQRLDDKADLWRGLLAKLNAGKSSAGSYAGMPQDVDAGIAVSLAQADAAAGAGAEEISGAGVVDAETGQQVDRGALPGQLRSSAGARVIGMSSAERAAQLKASINYQQGIINGLSRSLANLQAGADSLKAQAELLRGEAEARRSEFKALADFCNDYAKKIKDALDKEDAKGQLAQITGELEAKAAEFSNAEKVKAETEALRQRQKTTGGLAGTVNIEAVALQRELDLAEKQGEDKLEANYLAPIADDLKSLESAYKAEADGKLGEVASRGEFFSDIAAKIRQFSEAEPLLRGDLLDLAEDALPRKADFYSQSADNKANALNENATKLTGHAATINEETQELSAFIGYLQGQLDLVKGLPEEATAQAVGTGELEEAAEAISRYAADATGRGTQGPAGSFDGSLREIGSTGGSAHSLQTQITYLEGLISGAEKEIEQWKNNHAECFP